MAYCTKCGAQVADGVAFCSKCGQPINAPRLARQSAFQEIRAWRKKLRVFFVMCLAGSPG